MAAMPRPVLRTERIELRPLTMEHLPLLVDLDADPEVLRHILGRARTEAEACDFWGPICGDAYADHLGLGFWVGFALGTEDFLGWWDVSPARGDLYDEAGRPIVPVRAEAGWRLRREFWRAGLASEGAAALFAHGFAVGLEVIWAETMAVNLASRGVMRRLGMRHVRTDVRSWPNPLPGAAEGEVIYEMPREEWLRRRGRIEP